MHLAVHHDRRYPSSVNHTPRPRKLAMQAVLPPSHAGALSQYLPEISEPMSSPFISCPQSLHSSDTTEGTASFPHIDDDPEGWTAGGLKKNSGGTSTPAKDARQPRRYRGGRPRSFSNLSWTDLSSSNVQPSGSEISMPLKKPMARGGPVNSANASFDIAYFLKNTGPRQQGAMAAEKTDRNKLRHKSALRFLKSGRKHSLATKVGTAEGKPKALREPSPLDYFVPTDCVVQKVSTKGKKYLQIIPHQEPAEWMTTGSIRCVSDDCKLPRISTVFADGGDGVDYDPLDVWIPKLESTKEYRKSYRSASTPGLSRDDTDLLSPPSSPTKVQRRSRSLSTGVVDLTRSILENQNIANACIGPTDFKEDVYSHLPTTEPVPVEEPPCVFGSEVVITELPDIQPVIPGGATQQYETTQHDDHRGRSMQRNSELLAGQGMRRSSSDYDRPPSVPPKALTEGQTQYRESSGDPDHERNDSAFDNLDQPAPKEQIKPKPNTLRPIRKTREDRVRARKLRDLERTRQNIDEIVERPFPDTPASSPIPSPLAGRLRPQPLKSARPRPPSLDTQVPAPTPGFKTGYTPSTSGSMCFSPIMQVAEQIPLKDKQIKKPARLLLKDGTAPTDMTVTVRSRTAPLEQLCCDLGEVDEAAGTVAGAEDDRDGYGDGSVTPESASPAAEPELPPLGAPLMRHLSAPVVLSQAQHSASGSRIQQSADGHITKEDCQNCKTLEVEIEALERENKLLEAALVAVLKTSGSLARESVRHERLHGERNTVIKLGDANDRRGSDSPALSESPLDVYLETVRAGQSAAH